MSEAARPVCPNCLRPAGGEYCDYCGQRQRTMRRAILPLVGELVRETLDVDGRLWRTLGRLLFRPGQLSLDYVEGRRARYVAPIRLYLVVSLSFFFVLSWQAGVDSDFAGDAVVLPDSGQPTDITALRSQIDERARALVDEIMADQERIVAQRALRELNEGVESQGEVSASKAFLLGRIVAVFHSPQQAVGALLENLPVVMFALLPLFALVMKIFYLGAGRYYIEHLIFAVHLHSFAFLIYLPLLLLPDGDPDGSWVDTVAGSAPLLVGIYHFAALRRFFGEGRLRTAVKLFGQLSVYMLVLIPIGAAAVVAVTLVLI